MWFLTGVWGSMCSTFYPQLFLNESLSEEATISKWAKNIGAITSGNAAPGVLRAFTIYYDLETFDYRWGSYGHNALMFKPHHPMDRPMSLVENSNTIINPGHRSTILISPTIYRTTQNSIDRFSMPSKSLQFFSFL